jgi:hypothetical protein
MKKSREKILNKLGNRNLIIETFELQMITGSLISFMSKETNNMAEGPLEIYTGRNCP